MNLRIATGVLALVGAAGVAAGCLLPYAGSGKYAAKIFTTEKPHALLWYAVEPAAVVLGAAVIGILMFVAAQRWMTGALAAMGVQTALMFAGYVGFNIHSSYSAKTGPGGWIGILGSLSIAAGGLVGILGAVGVEEAGSDGQAPSSVAAPPPAQPPPPGQPAGWYPDPSDASRLRYWSGSGWTEHLHERPADQQ